jgi:hypothetical protein
MDIFTFASSYMLLIKKIPIHPSILLHPTMYVQYDQVHCTTL